MRRDTAWIFNLGADIYAWFTAQPTWRASCARMAARLPPTPGIRVADLGCGPGVSAIEIARRRPDARVVGLDRAPRMLAEARRRSRTARPEDRGDVRLSGQAGKQGGGGRPIGWVLGDAARLPFADASLDAVTGHSFLYLLPDRETALGEMSRVLRPGGVAVLMEPHACPATPGQILRAGRDPRHLFAVALWRPFSRVHGRYTRKSLAAALEAAGFVDCRVDETIGGLGLLASARRA
ncbi:MAG: methyltransferase domain-containing protein [Chloroflexota bacterium]|nr:methyltransferase domain-containing protein [Chloroflexota bacterium]